MKMKGKVLENLGKTRETVPLKNWENGLEKKKMTSSCKTFHLNSFKDFSPNLAQVTLAATW